MENVATKLQSVKDDLEKELASALQGEEKSPEQANRSQHIQTALTRVDEAIGAVERYSEGA